MKNKILKASELLKIRVRDNDERLIIPEKNEVIYDYRRNDSEIQEVLLRESLVRMLESVQDRLKRINVNLQLLVVEGYRSPEYQERYYLQELCRYCKIHPEWDFEQLLEQTHQVVALPSVAGHPTGGAVDLTLAVNGREIDMGGKIANFSQPKLLPTFSPLANPEQAYWRLLLHDAMVAEGFAPFYGEWWHYSFGDREWAAFYGYSETLYAPQSYER
jgi:D-alanyl-D-alanine dipeptidase